METDGYYSSPFIRLSISPHTYTHMNSEREVAKGKKEKERMERGVSLHFGTVFPRVNFMLDFPHFVPAQRPPSVPQH